MVVRIWDYIYIFTIVVSEIFCVYKSLCSKLGFPMKALVFKSDFPVGAK